MNAQPELWTSNTLRRTTGQAYITLQRARQREIEYPSIKNVTPTVQESIGHTSVEDAYTTVMQSLSTASRNCLRYYRSTPAMEYNKHDRRFCSKYLTQTLTEKRRRNPLQDEDVQIVVSPGTYSISAATLGGDRVSQQTHVIKVGKGETAAIDFTI
uniref:uncharacterized protein LOC120335665 n=1 Tax=Styela clava TaxID=7725 RepID=UPI00193A128E|nr:uncharacterized protein LOC120335665 [Styela clava]